MNDQKPLDDWEQELARDLDALPELEAPSTLIPRVMKRLPASVPWYQSSWWRWPSAVRVASVLTALVLLVVLGWLSGTYGDLGLWRQLTAAWGKCETAMNTVVNTLETVLGSGAVFWSQHGQTILLGTAFLLLATYLTGVAAGTALYRFAWRKAL